MMLVDQQVDYCFGELLIKPDAYVALWAAMQLA